MVVSVVLYTQVTELDKGLSEDEVIEVVASEFKENGYEWLTQIVYGETGTSPADRIDQANDATAREDIQSILEAYSLYRLDNSGNEPIHKEGYSLPTVTTSNIMTNGADVTDIKGLVPTYISNIPDNGYKVGVLASGAVIIGATLSDGTVFTVTE